MEIQSNKTSEDRADYNVSISAEGLEEPMPDMTLEEARESLASIVNVDTFQKLRIYLLWKRNGYKRMGFQSFPSFCEERLERSHSTVSKWIEQAETTLHANGISLRQLHNKLLAGFPMGINEIESLPSKDTLSLLPRTVTEPLHKLSSAQDRREVWQEFLKTHTGEKGFTAKDCEDLEEMVKAVAKPNLQIVTKDTPKEPAPVREPVEIKQVKGSSKHGAPTASIPAATLPEASEPEFIEDIEVRAVSIRQNNSKGVIIATGHLVNGATVRMEIPLSLLKQEEGESW